MRIPVERLWPRGLAKDRAQITLWMKEIAPSRQLRQWYGHDPKKWPAFRERYRAELREKADLREELRRTAARHTVTPAFASRDVQRCSAAVFKEVLEGRF